MLEHAPGATRSIIEGHANTGAFDLTIRNTVADGPIGSARYGWHTDYVHRVQTPDTEGDINRSYSVDFHGVKFIVGPSAEIQTFGAGIGVQAEANFTDCAFHCENSGYVGPLVCANNSSGKFGGGNFNFKGCADRTGRPHPAKTIGVQTKTNAENPNIVRVDDCVGFERIALSPGSVGIFQGKWLLKGNTPMTVLSTIPGDALGT
ncbi:MAG: hypothetical protein ACR2FJ_09400 [Qipengyuania sp.]